MEKYNLNKYIDILKKEKIYLEDNLTDEIKNKNDLIIIFWFLI